MQFLRPTTRYRRGGFLLASYRHVCNVKTRCSRGWAARFTLPTRCHRQRVIVCCICLPLLRSRLRSGLTPTFTTLQQTRGIDFKCKSSRDSRKNKALVLDPECPNSGTHLIERCRLDNTITTSDTNSCKSPKRHLRVVARHPNKRA